MVIKHTLLISKQKSGEAIKILDKTLWRGCRLEAKDNTSFFFAVVAVVAVDPTIISSLF